MNSNSSDEKPVRLRERLREATADAILSAAEQAFSEEGAKARMESIAARAGIAVGTLYNHFADRDALWDALCRSRRDALLDRLDAALDATRGEPFPAALRAFANALHAHWSRHRAFLTLLVQTEPALSRAGARATRERTTLEELVARAAKLVRRGVAEGALRADGADLWPVLLVGMMRAVMVRDLARDPGDAEATLERVVGFFLAGAGRAG
jgi:AcrR family transcriptional regulator